MGAEAAAHVGGRGERRTAVGVRVAIRQTVVPGRSRARPRTAAWFDEESMMWRAAARLRSGGMTIDKVNLAAKLALIDEPWQPRVAGQVNDSHIKLVKLSGEFVWHHHEHEDELFLVISGRLCMKLRDRDVWLDEGELIIIPRGTDHCPFAPAECHVLLVEPVTTLNTGNVRNERTIDRPASV